MKKILQGFKKKRCQAYMTLEASFIVPVAVMICVLVIMYLFYMYNNCVVYQDCYIAALRGSQIMDASTSEVRNKVIAYADELLDNQIYQYSRQPVVEVGLMSVKVSASTRIDMVAQGLSLYNEPYFGSQREAQCMRTDPTELVRAIH